MTARDFDPACEDCNRLHMNLMWARGDFGDLRRKSRSQRAGADVFDRLAAAKTELTEKTAAFEAHAAEVHPDGFGRVSMPRAALTARPKAKPVPEGKVVCETCRKPIGVVGDRLRRHKDKTGFPCPNLRVPGQTTALVEPPPPVHLPRLSARSAQGRARRGESEPSRLDVGGQCRECGKWLPGERSLCGRCSVLQGRAS